MRLRLKDCDVRDEAVGNIARRGDRVLAEGRLPKHTLEGGRLVDQLVYAAVRQP